MGGVGLKSKTELTQRERAVLQLICRGLSNKEIARDLDCALKTVECHVTSILRKAGVGSRLQLAVAEQLRLRVSPDSQPHTR